MSELGTRYRHADLSYSPEDPILGTAGGIRRAGERGLLAPEFFVANGDVYTTLPLEPLLRARQDTGAVSALAVLPNRDPSKETPLWSENGRLVAVGGERPAAADGPWLFTGLQAATEGLLQRIPQGVSELARDVLRPSATARDGAFVLVPFETPQDGFWFDLGTPERLAHAEREVGTAPRP